MKTVLMALMMISMMSTKVMAASFTNLSLLPSATSMTTADGKAQEIIIMNDAIDFLAGNEASEILMEAISQIRVTYSEVQDLTDEEIAQLIVTQ